jgi:hypothetical protein
VSEQDEWMPRERGLSLGNAWARMMRVQGAQAVDAEGRTYDLVAEAAKEPPVIAAQVRDLIMEGGMRERLDASEDPDAEGAFWAGFRDGVRAYLVELDIGAGPN